MRRSLIFTAKSPGVPGTHFINLGRIELALKPLSNLEPGTPGLGIRRLNDYAIPSTPVPKVLRWNPDYMLSQALELNLIPRFSGTFGSHKIKCSD